MQTKQSVRWGLLARGVAFAGVLSATACGGGSGGGGGMSPGSMPGWINPSASACFSPSSNVTTLSRTLTCPSGATPPAPGGGYENCSFFVQAVPYGVATSQIDVSPAFVTVPAGDSATVNFTLTALGTVPPLRQDFDLIAWQRNTRSTNPERVNLNAKLNVVADHNRHLCI